MSIAKCQYVETFFIKWYVEMRKRLKGTQINLFYIPAVILFCVFVAYPLVKGIRISFTNWNGYSQHMKFVGLKNYRRLFTDKNVLTALKNTMIYGLGSTLIQNVIGLLYALFLNRKFRGSAIVRSVVYIPAMVAPLIMGYVLYFFFQYDSGALNDILLFFGKEKLDFLADAKRAVRIITIVNSLQFVGCSMVIYLAGLQNIPQMYHDAAQVDGASKWQEFWNVTLPLLMPAITSSVVINLIGGLKLYDLVMAMTKGGPGYGSHSMSTMVSYQYLNNEAAGYSAVIGIAMFLIIVVFSNIALTYFSKRESQV